MAVNFLLNLFLLFREYPFGIWDRGGDGEESVECSIQYIAQNYIEVLLFLSLRVWFSLLLLQVAKQLKEQQMVMRGHRDKSMVHELNR